MSGRYRRLYGPIGGAALLVFALIGLGLAIGYRYQHADNRDQAAEDSANAGPKKFIAECAPVPKPGAPPCVMYAEEPEGADEYAKQDLKAQQDMAEWAFAMFWASMAGVAITFVGVLYVAATLNETRNATAAAQTAANAAHDANAGFQSASRRELRAYVSHADMVCDPVPMQDEGGRITGYNVGILWKNNGTTPGRRVRVKTNVATLRDQLPPNFEFEDHTPTTTESPSLAIGPQCERKAAGFVPISNLIAVWRKAERLYVWGWVEYSDVFEDAPRHRTEACFELVILSNPDTPSGFRLDAPHWKVFNGADEDCLHQPKTH